MYPWVKEDPLPYEGEALGRESSGLPEWAPTGLWYPADPDPGKIFLGEEELGSPYLTIDHPPRGAHHPITVLSVFLGE